MPQKIYCKRCDRTLGAGPISVEIKRGVNTYRVDQDVCENCFSWFMFAITREFPDIKSHGPESKDTPSEEPKPKN